MPWSGPRRKPLAKADRPRHDDPRARRAPRRNGGGMRIVFTGWLVVIFGGLAYMLAVVALGR